MSHHYIKYDHVYFSYPEGEEVLKDISFLITHGEKVALLGLNGAGKSTLIQTTNGLLMPTSGEINIGGIPLIKKTLRQIRQNVGMVFQNPDDQLFMSTVEEDVAFGPYNMNLPKDEIERRVEKALRQVGKYELRKRNPAQLSGGQKRMVAFATVLSMEPNIMVLDEPSAGLDWKARNDLIEIIRGFHHTCLIATHDLDLASSICDRVLVINNGRIAADTTMNHFLKDPKLLEMVGINAETMISQAVF